MFRHVPGRHSGNINTQIVYTATLQTSCNNNHFIILDNFNVLKVLLILTRAAIVHVIWQGNEGKLPDDDTFGVETFRSLII